MFVLVENNSITKTVNSHKGITIGEKQYPRAIYTLWTQLREKRSASMK